MTMKFEFPNHFCNYFSIRQSERNRSDREADCVLVCAFTSSENSNNVHYVCNHHSTVTHINIYLNYLK